MSDETRITDPLTTYRITQDGDDYTIIFKYIGDSNKEEEIVYTKANLLEATGKFYVEAAERLLACQQGSAGKMFDLMEQEGTRFDNLLGDDDND